MSWLDEVEDYIDDLPLDGPTLQDMQIMARVIRELVEWAKTLAQEYHPDIVMPIWDNLSPDAKELLE